jgi:molybdopterin-biosynthesis enzyme MoeA-like protein
MSRESQNGPVPSLEGLHDEQRKIKAAISLTNETVKNHGAAIGALQIEVAGFKESVLSELLNVKQETAAAVAIALRPSRREVQWRRFWRIANPALVAAFLEALHKLDLVHLLK